MAERTLTIELVAGTPRADIWCDRCLTSAGFEIDVFVLGCEGLSSPISVIRNCARCDYDDDDD